MHSLSKRVSTTAFFILGLAGCGSSGPDLLNVTGTVTMDEKPLPDAWVQFVPQTTDGRYARPSSGMTDEDGYYELEYSTSRTGTLPGQYIVSIMTGRGADNDATGNPVPAVPETVPMAYNYESELTAEVSADNTVFDFDLDSTAGPIIGQRQQTQTGID